MSSLLGGSLAAVGDVLADGAVEQPGVLEDHPERPAQVVAGQLARVDAVDQDAAGVDLVEAHEQVDERRLAGAGRPDDGDRLAGRDVEIEVVDERLVRLVAERDALEGDRAAGPPEDVGLDRVGDLLALVDQLEDPLGRGRGGLDDVDDAGGLDDRERELPRVLDERDHVAQATSGRRRPAARR